MTKSIKIGDKIIGGARPVAIQSMTNTKTHDVEETVAQILELEDHGCEIIRVAVPDKEAALALPKIKERIHIPLIADIHFDPELALLAIENGADKIRINPGNLKDDDIERIIKKAQEYKIPIRIGVNSGTLEKEILEKYGRVTPEGLVESLEKKIKLFEEKGFDDIVLSVKSSNVRDTIEVNRLIAKRFPYPIHLGVTEAGLKEDAVIKSALAFGGLLNDGIGDTIRVSITGNPVEEVEAAKKILKFLNLKNSGPELISCPTCGRTEIDLIGLAEKVQKLLETTDKDIKVAVMGCVVNGPGEAKEADIGVAGGKGKAVIFKKGEVIKSVEESQILEALKEEIESLSTTHHLKGSGFAAVQLCGRSAQGRPPTFDCPDQGPG